MSAGHQLLQALAHMTHTRMLLGELAGNPALPDDLARRIIGQRDELARFVADVQGSPQRPAATALLDHVMQTRGVTERVAMIEIRKRRMFDRCEWCGSNPPESSRETVMTCKSCRAAIAAAAQCAPTDDGGVANEREYVCQE